MELNPMPTDERLVIISTIAIFLSSLHSGHSVHQESTQTSNSGCYGISGPLFMTSNCTIGYVVAIEQIWVGAKQTSTGCPTLFDISYNESCCSPSADPVDDCIWAFDHSNYDNYHSACNGNGECTVRVQNVLTVLGSCNQTIFPLTSLFAYIDYVCIDASSITTMCSTTSTTIASSSTYIASEDFPNDMATSTSACTCSVQTDDPSATLQVVTIQRQLTGNSGGSCNQSLSLLDSGHSPLVEWSCSDNTYVEETFDVGSDYVILHLNNDRTAADGNFWVEIRASSPTANLMVDCPAQARATITTTTTTRADTTTTTTTTAATTTATDANTTPQMQNSSTADDSSTDAYIIGVICLSAFLGCSLVANAVLACMYKHVGNNPREQQSSEVLPRKRTPVLVYNQRFNRRNGINMARNW